MKFLNFGLAAPSFAIELMGLDFVWDLHNAGKMQDLTLNVGNNTVVMRWNVGGHPATKYSGCSLIFIDLKLLLISARDGDLPLSEDFCVSGISKVVPRSDPKSPHRTKSQWGIDEEFHLLFEFQSGRSIEIDSETVKLEGW